MEIEPGTLCERELPWEARLELKLWRVMTPVKPRPLLVPVTSTNWPGSNISIEMFSPGLKLASCSAVTVNSFSTVPPLWRGCRRAWTAAAG